MESKIIIYGIILLHKYKVEQTVVISRLLFAFVTYKLQENLVRIFIFLIHFHTSLTVAISRVQKMARSKTRKPRKSRKSRKFLSEIFISEFCPAAKIENSKIRKLGITFPRYPRFPTFPSFRFASFSFSFLIFFLFYKSSLIFQH